MNSVYTVFKNEQNTTNVLEVRDVITFGEEGEDKYWEGAEEKLLGCYQFSLIWVVDTLMLAV